jgi:DNA (cytosine-5)-methyltransferase 1
MVGNAVPINLACILAHKIFIDIQEFMNWGLCHHLRQINQAKQLTLLI